MADTLREKLLALTPHNGEGLVSLEDVLRLLDGHCGDKVVIKKVGDEIEKAVDDSNGEWTTRFKQYVAKAAISALIGDNTKREG